MCSEPALFRFNTCSLCSGGEMCQALSLLTWLKCWLTV